MNKKQLQFKNGKFKIMLLGDLHENFDLKKDNGAAKWADCKALLEKSIDELKPDLVVYMGDNTCADNIEDFKTAIDRIVTPCVNAEVPFSIVFGNHDREHGVELKSQLEIYESYENCVTFNADDTITGCGNCNILVKNTVGDKNILNLWFMDSNNLSDDKDVSYYDWVHDDQIKWYENIAKKIKDENGEIVPAVLFQHIPVCEEYDLLRKAKISELPVAVKGHQHRSDTYYVLKDTVEGYMGEGPCTPSLNNGQFQSWKRTGDVFAAFFGHDHMNDFVGYVEGIMLGQCKLAGFRPYTDGCRSGVRLLTFDENNVTNLDTRMYYFKKDFHLKSKSLEFYQRHITDRQDLNMKAALKLTGSVAGGIVSGKIIGSTIGKILTKK